MPLERSRGCAAQRCDRDVTADTGVRRSGRGRAEVHSARRTGRAGQVRGSGSGIRSLQNARGTGSASVKRPSSDSTNVGATALTVTPKLAHSSASTRVSMFNPALLLAYATRSFDRQLTGEEEYFQWTYRTGDRYVENQEPTVRWHWENYSTLRFAYRAGAGVRHALDTPIGALASRP